MVPPMQAQFVCTITSGKVVGQNFLFGYRVVSKGNICFVAAYRVLDTSQWWSNELVFLRSIDGGHSWDITDPKVLDTIATISRLDLIDSSHLIAYGSGGGAFGIPPYEFTLRSSNGGVSWIEDTISLTYGINDMSSTDSLHGLFVGGGGAFVTSDGGAHWDSIPFPLYGLGRCHDYGHGMYRGFNWQSGEIYTTTDGGSTFDSTAAIVGDPVERTQYYFEDCAFGPGDTMIAFGWRKVNGSDYPCIARTTNAGQQWSLVFEDTTKPSGWVPSISDAGRDTIVAGIRGWQNAVLCSTNNGATWSIDSLLWADTNMIVNVVDGIGLNSGGEMVGAFGQVFGSDLVIGRHMNLGIRHDNIAGAAMEVYPTPATTTVWIHGGSAGSTLHVFDILSRDVQSRIVPPDGSLMLDVSHLPRGVYTLTTETDGVMTPCVRIPLIGE